MNRKKIGIIVLVAAIVAGGILYFTNKMQNRSGKQIQINNTPTYTGPANTGDVSPISGLACADWNRRPFAVMQPADLTARPAAGFSDADMVFEMPVITNSITRLMAVYVCGNPDDVGSMRSARHDYIALAKGLDAIFVHWGGSHYAIDKLKEGVIDDMNCNNDGGKSAQKYCYRKEQTGTMKGDDTGYAKFAQLVQGAKDFGYVLTNTFAGYPHQAEAPVDQRPEGGHLRLAFPKPFDVSYDYDKNSNSYLRTWGGTPATDRNSGDRIAPKNIVVMVADSSQIVEGEQYNNVQIGDPWYDSADSGSMVYYMNGKEFSGTWKKDKTNLASKLFFYDQSGQEVQFVPGQIWVDVVEPTYSVHWSAGTTAGTADAGTAAGTTVN